MKTYQEEQGTGEKQQIGLEVQTNGAVAPQEARNEPGLAERLWTRAGLASEVTGGLLEAACALGIAAVQRIFEEEVTEIVGPKGKHDVRRQASRHGHDDVEVTFGGRRMLIRRPRIRTINKKKEIPLCTVVWAAGRDVLNRTAYDRLLAGVSTRNYHLTLEPVTGRSAHRPRSTSKSTISRRFTSLTKGALDELLTRDLSKIKPVVLMIDGLHVAGQMLIAAMVIDMDGRKHPVGLRAGATENARVVKDLLTDLKDRGLDTSCGVLVVIDGSKALGDNTFLPGKRLQLPPPGPV